MSYSSLQWRSGGSVKSCRNDIGSRYPTGTTVAVKGSPPYFLVSRLQDYA